jgi:DNA-binding LacI/PurR family transcriptional regulator
LDEPLLNKTDKMTVKTANKTDQLTEILKKALHGKGFKPGAKFYTEREIAARYSVSRTIASKAIYRLVAENRLESKHGSGTYVIEPRNNGAHPLTLGLLYLGVYGLANPMCRLFLHGLHDEMLITNPEAIIQPVEYLGTRDNLALNGPNHVLEEIVESNIVKGVFLTSPISPADVEYFYSKDVKLISLLGGSVRGVPAVVVEISDIAQTAARFIRELGLRRIGAIFVEQSFREDNDPMEFNSQFILTLINEGFIMDRNLIIEVPDYKREFGQMAFRKMWGNNVKPEVIVVVDDIVGLGLLDEAKEQGVRIPEDVQVISIPDCLEYSPFTCVHLPLQEIGKQAVHVMDKLLAGEEVEERTVLHASIVKRNTHRDKEIQ